MFCQHQNIFGKPREGAHSYRIPGVDLAAVDVAATFVLAFLIYLLVGHSLGYITAGLFGVGIIAHALFGVPTKLNVALFGKPAECPGTG
jgi:hypothetical protein